MANFDPDRDSRLIPEPLRPGVILTDIQIEQLVSSGALVSRETFDRRGLDACSYDVRVGRKGIIGGQGQELDLTKQPMEVGPGAYAAIISEEKVKLPANIVARINSKRSFSYEGIALLTGSQIDPGYEGHLLFAFYNASSKRIVIRKGRAICSLVFEALESDVTRPKPHDPDLLRGDFPDKFVNDMANMEVLSWAQLNEHVKEIDKIATDLLELRSKYENVVEPIKTLTQDVDKLTKNVDKLSESIKRVSDDMGDLEKITGDNAKQISELGQNVKFLVFEVGGVKKDTEKHSDRIGELATRFGRFSFSMNIIWTLLVLVLGGLFTKYLLPLILGESPK